MYLTLIYLRMLFLVLFLNMDKVIFFSFIFLAFFFIWWFFTGETIIIESDKDIQDIQDIQDTSNTDIDKYLVDETIHVDDNSHIDNNLPTSYDNDICSSVTKSDFSFVTAEIVEKYNRKKNPQLFKKTDSQGEIVCRKVLESVYGLEFSKCRPQWLKNPETNYPLELDCYNEKLKLALEYNGEQHYKWPNFLDQSYDDFIKQVRRDQFKKEVCAAKNVYLIIVPYNVPLAQIPKYIRDRLPERIYLENKKSLN